ncbi:MAG: hypothetical protein IJ367_03025 [Clostridia bacterium]|nr:hypothetical protein [Clostridia bacterium]
MLLTEIRRDCYWYRRRCGLRAGCMALTELQCEINGTCSFYEKDETFKTRTKGFDTADWTEPERNL